MAEARAFCSAQKLSTIAEYKKPVMYAGTTLASTSSAEGSKRMGFSSVSSFGKVLILQRQQAHGAHVHVHAVAKVGVDDKELGDLAPVEEIQKLRRDLSRAAERGALRIVAEALFHRHAVAGEEVPPVAAHHKKAAVGVLFKAASSSPE